MESDPTRQNRLPFYAADYRDDGKKHVLLAASGSVATIKLGLLARRLAECGNVSIRVVVTGPASRFLNQLDGMDGVHLRDLDGVDDIYTDEDEWANPWKRGDGILHIELRKWCDVLVIAPLSANTMAKIAAGMADNLLTSIVRAWDTTGMVDGTGQPRRMIVAPAMNTAMWLHPVTRSQLDVIAQWTVSASPGASPSGWIQVMMPGEKTLACGDSGIGAMCEWSVIADEVIQLLGLKQRITT